MSDDELSRLRRENAELKARLETKESRSLEEIIEAQQQQFATPGKFELRSDTLTKPTAAMRVAMATSEVGDAVWGTDPTVKALEQYVAELTGKEAALFVPSGVMGNVVCVLAHCDARISEVILGDKAHQLLYETSNIAALGGVQPRAIPNLPDGTLPLEGIAAALRGYDQHWPTTRAVLLENTQNFTGGKVLPMGYVREVRKICDSHLYPVALHCDGARAWHAAIALGVSMKELLEPFDSASLCLSKALGAPVGSVIVGTKALVDGKARRLVKMLGGGMRQSGTIAAAGLHAVKHHFARLSDDHALAKALYKAFAARDIDAIEPQTNILIWHVPATVKAAALVERCASHGIMIGSIGPHTCRAIPHLNCGVTFDDVEKIALTVSSELKALSA